LHKATISFVVSVYPHSKPQLPLDKFGWFDVEYFLKICWESSSCIKIWQEIRVLSWKHVHSWYYLAGFL